MPLLDRRLSERRSPRCARGGRPRVLAGVVTCAFFALATARLPAWGGERAVRSLLEMRHENVVIQKWDLSCGAATLATVLRYQHGRDVTEKQVATGLMARDEYLKNPKIIQAHEGFSLLDLKRYVDSDQLQGVGFGKLSLEDLEHEAPIIVPIRVRGYNHFVVFRARFEDRVLLSDPAWGNRVMPVEDFMTSWIEYPAFGRVGFVVQRRDKTAPPNQLLPLPQDFVM